MILHTTYGNQARYLLTCNQYWNPPKYANPKTTKILLRFQSISSNVLPSATTWAKRSAALVLHVAMPN